MIEIAARSIGGLCSRALRFGVGVSLEELILRHALGRRRRLRSSARTRAAGVMMIPIPRAGFCRTCAASRTRRIPGIEDVTITVRPGQTIVPLPEGASYLGFLFARGDSPAAVEKSLRDAHAALSFAIAPRADTHLRQRDHANAIAGFGVALEIFRIAIGSRLFQDVSVGIRAGHRRRACHRRLHPRFRRCRHRRIVDAADTAYDISVERRRLPLAIDRLVVAVECDRARHG